MAHREAVSDEATVHHVVQALVSGNPQDTFRARDYLKQNTNLVERVISLLQQMKRDREATQIQQDFLGINPPQQQTFKNTASVVPQQSDSRGTVHSTSMYGNTQPAYQYHNAPLAAAHQQYPPQPIQATAGQLPAPQPIQHYGNHVGGVMPHTYPYQQQQQQMLQQQNRILGISPTYPQTGYVSEVPSMPHPQYYTPTVNEQAYTPMSIPQQQHHQQQQGPGVVPPAHYQAHGQAHTVLNGLQYSYGGPPTSGNVYYHHP